MTPQTIGLIIGGLIPALCFGLSGIFLKASMNAGIGLAFMLIVVGIGSILTGIIFYVILPEKVFTTQSVLFALAVGSVWAVGNGLVALALVKYKIPIGQLAPMYNMNTLVAVLLGLWVFSEWQQVDTVKLLIGAVLVVIGGALVSQA